MSRDPLLLLEDIEKSCAKVIRFTNGLSKEEVLEDELRADAVLLNLHIIGEAVKKLPMIYATGIQRSPGERSQA